MLKRKLAAIIVVAIITNLSTTPLSVFADTLNNNIVQAYEELEKEITTEAKVSKFNAYYSEYRDTYDKSFKMDNANVISITSLGGNLRETVGTKNIMDGSLDTYWETGKHTSDSFNNELIFTLEEETVLNRIAYRSAWNTVGFAEVFEIWASNTEDGNDFKLVSNGATIKTADVVEIKFKPTSFKRVKFVFKNKGTATVSEMMFYKEDEVLDKINSIFTDNTLSKVSEEFKEEDKINSLEEKAMLHPLYEEYKDYFSNAKALLNQETIIETEAKISKFDIYYTDERQAYDEAFKMNNDNIQSITSTGGKLNNYVGTENITDGKLDTYWETGRHTSSSFNNELIFTLNEETVLNRIAYRSAWNTVGFAENFEVWASSTTKGDTFQLVTSATTNKTADVVEIKFNPTSFKRIKFVFKNNGTATASEMMFYKEDSVSDNMSKLFADDTYTKVSEEFNNEEALNKLEVSIKDHPLYSKFKQSIDDARAIINNKEIEATIATMRKVTYNDNEEYNDLYKVSRENIESITAAGGQYLSQYAEYAIDGDIKTYWETGKGNNDSFKNEVEVTFKNPVKIDRVLYAPRQSDLKGFATEIEIYGSKTSKGDTYELVATGSYNKVSGVVEAKFNETEFKRLKFRFKNSDQNWASLSEIIFYEADSVYNAMDRLFTDGTMSVVSNEFNSINKINELEEELANHPLKSELQEKLSLAKSIVKGEVDFSKNTFTLKQNGDVVTHIRNNLKMASFGTNLQSTGIVAKPGETFKVYVETEDGKPLPKIVFTQQEGSYSNWQRTYSLSKGVNVITVPEIYSDSWSKKSNKGGAVYLLNPYTEEKQGKAPIVRIEGGEHFPLFNEGDNVEEFLEELKAYKEKLNQNPDTMVDIYEFNAYRLMFTGTTSAAYQVYINEGVNVDESVNVWDEKIDEGLKFAGLSDNPNDVKNDSTNIRTAVRLMQPYGAAYAAGDHIGLQRGVMEYFLRIDDYHVNDIIWGTMHEVGHQLEIRAREWGEVTNNMWANYASILNGKSDRIEYETLYKTLAPEDSKRTSEDVVLEMFWQLQLANENYWASLERMYRENNPSVPNYQAKKDTLAKYSSEIFGMNLTPYFEKYNFTLSDECKAELATLPDMDKKIWYVNTSAMNYDGTGFNDNVNVEITSINNNSDNTITLTFDIDKENRDDLLGYEIVRDGKVIGFTSTNTFKDSNVDINENHKYEVVAYARDLSNATGIEINSKTPNLLVNNKITLKLNEEFKPLDYVNATDYLGNEITNITVSNNVDTTKKGIYNVTYEVTSNDIKVTKNTSVEVVSNYNYLSDIEWTSATTGYGSIRKDNDLTLLINGKVKSFDKGVGLHAKGELVYDLSGKDYDKFEAFIGVSRSIPEQNNSSITYSILADGNEIYNSGVMKYNTEAQYVSLNVKGVEELRIIIGDANNGISSDHAVIANPIFTTNNVKPILEIGQDESIELRSDYDLRYGINATDIEDGNLTDSIIVNKNGFTTDKTGEYTIEYSITDSDGNTTMANKKILVYSEEKYLSDIDWKSARTDYGSVRKDKASVNSNIKLLIDGQVKEFTKGIGTHANSEIIYNLENSNYEYFETYVGVDRNIAEQNNSSVIFKIYADDIEVYNSGLMKYNTEAKFVRITVNGVKELRLVADNAGNGNASDHADFADAKFLITNSRPVLTIPESISATLGNPININQEYSAVDIEDGNLTKSVKVEGTVNFDKTGKYPITYTVTDSDGNTVTKTRTIAVVDMDDFTYLSDLDWKSETHTYTAPVKNIAINGSAISLTDEKGNSKTFEKGIGSHATTTITYDLTGKDYAYFTSYIGVTRNMYNSIASIGFDVYVDGVLKYSSEVMTGKMPMKFIKVDINDAKELKLVVNDGGNNIGSDHGAWADAKLHSANENGASINRTELNELIETINNLDSKIYTEDSFNNLIEVLEDVNTNLADGYNQEEVDKLYNDLKQAYDALVKSTDFSQLKETIDNNSKLNELHYYKDAITAHKALVEEAKKVLENENATQEEIDGIVNRLKESAEKLVIRGNKIQLENKIKEAKEIKNNNYQSARWENFLWAINYAEGIYNNIDATDTDISSALFTLEYMKGELK